MYGGSGYDFLSVHGFAMLSEKIGLTEEQFRTIMVDNPRRLMTGEE
jgi:predicted metal-dependent phosphotriesterase family hydrolase